MAKKFLVVLMTIVMFFSITSFVRADNSEVTPDIISNKIIWIAPASRAEMVAELKDGTLGIVSLIGSYYVGFDIPGGKVGTDIIVFTKSRVQVEITTPVGLKLSNGQILVYFAKNVGIFSLAWNDLSISEIKNSWFPQYINAQIIKIEDTGAWESEKNYCCNPPLQKTSYFYKLYLTTKIDPYVPPKESNIELGVMIPDYFVDTFLKLAANGDHIWIGVNGDNQIYIWLSY